MKIWQAGLALSGVLFLGACGSIARSVADNTEVVALPLANAKVKGTLNAVQAVKSQTLTAQALAEGTLTFSTPFGDFDPKDLPSIVGNPSALDVPIAISGASFDCKPTAPSVNMTVKSVTLSAKDAGTPGGVSSSQSNLNIVVPMTRAGDGTYSVAGGKATLLALKLNWAAFAPVVVKNGANTPNTATLTLGVQTDNITAPCDMTVTLAPGLKQNVRF